MFGSRCIKCGKKANSSFNFCPHCGSKKKSENEIGKEFGLLGLEDVKIPGFQMLFQNLVKEIGRQFQRLDKEGGEERKSPVQGISINISTVGGRPLFDVNRLGNQQEIKKVKISEEMERKLSTLPRKEAETSVRRLSNKIVYELDLPGVKHVDNIIISKLESSFEIKAIGTDAIFFKLIPLNLALLGYGLRDEKLVMEFKG